MQLQQSPLTLDHSSQLTNDIKGPGEGTWGNTFGIKRLSDAEWEEHERKRKAKFDQR